MPTPFQALLGEHISQAVSGSINAAEALANEAFADQPKVLRSISSKLARVHKLMAEIASEADKASPDHATPMLRSYVSKDGL